ncbi:hypothetical protein LUZ60_011023 [Juncus effusus]|nr:hypothetical protein LUZ60_011023 [Juncus effusus]
MARYKFKLSDMIPNAWFYKMREMNQNRSRNYHQSSMRRRGLHQSSITPRRSFTSPIQTPKQSFTPNRASYYHSTRVVEERKLLNSPIDSPKRLDTNFAFEPPRKSSRRSPRRRVKLINARNSYDGRDKIEQNASKNDGECKVITSEADVIFDVSSKKRIDSEILEATKNKGSCEITDLGLPPILTTSESCKKNDSSDAKNERTRSKKKRSPLTARRMSMRVNSPVVSQKKSSLSSESRSSEGLKESFAVVKVSEDPQKDFRESMVEMIVENDMRSLDDLEELLACYLSLNSREYHGVIVKVFKQIWLDFHDFRM